MLDPTQLAPLLALGAAFCFAMSSNLQGVGLERADPHSATLVNITTGAVVYWALAPLYVEWWYWTAPAIGYFVLCGIFRPPLSMTFAMMAIRRMGPTLSSAFASTSPMFATAFAIALLGEELTPATAAGTLAIVAGAIIASFRRGNLKRDWPIWAIGLPLGAACIRAAAQAITKLGLNDLPSPMFASLVGYTVGALTVALVFVANRRTFTGDVRAHKWFVMSGMVSGLGIFCLNTGLQYGTLLTVAPLVATAPLFTAAISLIIFRRENLTLRSLASILLIVTGVVLLILR